MCRAGSEKCVIQRSQVKKYDSSVLTVTSNSTQITVELSQTSLTDLGSFMQHTLDLSHSGQTESMREVAHLQVPQILISISF